MIMYSLSSERRYQHEPASTLTWWGSVYKKPDGDVLGHSQISLTMNTYAHVLEETRRDAAEGIEKLLFDS
jgi:hypothetical protein